MAQTKKEMELLKEVISKHLDNDRKEAISISSLPQTIRVMDTNITVESDLEPVVTHTTNGWEVRFKE